MCTLSVSKVIYHKFSHGAAIYTLNGKNVNVMLEFTLSHKRIASDFILNLSRPISYVIMRVIYVILRMKLI